MNSSGSLNPAKGIACMLVGVALLTSNDAILKGLAVDYPVGQMLAVRGVFVFLPVVLLAWRAGGTRALRVRSLPAQSLRAALTVVSTFLFVTGLSLMPIADAIAVVVCGPLFITAMAQPLLGEQVGWRRWSAVVLGFAGVLVMLRPGSETLRWVVVFPLLGAFAGALRDIVTRRISLTETSTATLAFSSAAVTFAGLATLPLGWRAMSAPDVAALALSGFLLGSAHFLLIEAFRYAEAATVAPFKFSNVVWAVLFGFVFWEELPDAWVGGGASLVVASGLYVVRRETRRETRRSSGRSAGA